ncbi:Hypothetical protein D9617_95g039950 [Elsinoe fawcettii]|nr:Hypothetical protein D9617_95g039950 [Elsinoe fawcettii]
MKTIKPLALAGLLGGTLAYQVHVAYDPAVVTVGDVDISTMVWKEIYQIPGNQNAVMYSKTSPARADVSKVGGSSSDTQVTAEVDGLRGKDPGMGVHESRDAIMAAYQDFMIEINKRENYAMWDHCVHVNGRNPLTPWYPKVSACTEDACVGCPSRIGLACRNTHLGTKVHASVKVLITNKAGAVLPDVLKVKFTCNKPQSQGGCGIAGSIGSALAGKLPGVGSLFSTGIDIACEHLI